MSKVQANEQPYNTTVFISDEDISSLADWPSIIEAIATAYKQPLKTQMVPPRIMARGEGFWLRSLCAVSPSGDYMGCKLIAASPKNARASYLISLFDQETMELVALIDGNQITRMRTAATSAVAVDLLSPNKPLAVGIVGSGAIAQAHLQAILATRRVASVKVFSPNPNSREAFAKSFQENYEIDISPVASAKLAVNGADVVVCAARSRDESPVFLGQWLTPGVTLVSIGSTLPEQREVDVETMARADLIVADMPEEVVHETGDSLRAMQAGHDIESKTVSLASVASGKQQGRKNANDIVVYKSVGSALQDIVTSEILLQRAKQTNAFTRLSKSVKTLLR